MRWLLRLYPKRWRARYGDEFAAILETQRPSIGLFVDVLAGALDAPAASDHTGALDRRRRDDSRLDETMRERRAAPHRTRSVARRAACAIAVTL